MTKYNKARTGIGGTYNYRRVYIIAIYQMDTLGTLGERVNDIWGSDVTCKGTSKKRSSDTEIDKKHLEDRKNSKNKVKLRSIFQGSLRVCQE